MTDRAGAVCEDRLQGRPLRVAGGFPCYHPAKGTYRLADQRPIVACGIHLRWAEKVYGDGVVIERWQA